MDKVRNMHLGIKFIRSFWPLRSLRHHSRVLSTVSSDLEPLSCYLFRTADTIFAPQFVVIGVAHNEETFPGAQGSEDP